MKNCSPQPNYKRIYSDLIAMKYPEKMTDCVSILSKSNLTRMDVILLDQKINGTSEVRDRATAAFNGKHRSYDHDTIIEMLDYQKKNKMSNVQLAGHFRLSRNTVAKWKKMFITE